MPGLQHVPPVGEAREIAAIPGTLDFQSLMEAASPEFIIQATDPEDLACCTSLAVRLENRKVQCTVHKAVIAHHMTGTYALDFHLMTFFGVLPIPGGATGNVVRNCCTLDTWDHQHH